MSAPINHRAAEERARQVLLMCDQIDSSRRRLDEPVNFFPQDVQKLQTEEGSHSPPSSSKTDLSSAEEDNPAPPLELDDLRRVMRQMQENAAIKYDKLEVDCTSLKLELVNVKFELEQATLKLRQAEKEKEKLLKSLDNIVSGNEQTINTLREENAEMAKKMQTLRAERDAALLENALLSNSSQRGGFRKICSLTRLKLGSGSIHESNADNVSIETESVTTDPDDCSQDANIHVVLETGDSPGSLSFKASTLR